MSCCTYEENEFQVTRLFCGVMLSPIRSPFSICTPVSITTGCRQLGAAQQQLAAHKRQLEEASHKAAGVQGITAELASLKVGALLGQILHSARHEPRIMDFAGLST